ncbi:hypothetical protein EV122DRAFT_294489 [Schizophyllum commune]
MDASTDSIASALRIAGTLSAQLMPALDAIQNAKRLTLECDCGKMAEGYAYPCKQPVCTVCVKDFCRHCKAQFSKPNAACPKHSAPRCPHKYCSNNNVVEYYRPEPGNGAELFKVVSEHGAHIQELLDHLSVLTKDM